MDTKRNNRLLDMNKRHEWQNKPLKINKKEKWALLFKFNKQGDRAEYYLKPVSELTGEKKETFLTIAQRVNDVPSHWKDRFKVNMYYYSESIIMGKSESYYLFVGDESNLKRVKEEFIKDNSDDTEFEPILSDMVKPETRRHFEGIIEQMNYNELVNYITESLEFDPEGQRILDDGKKIADYEVDVVENVTKENIIEYFENAYNDPAVKYIRKLKLPKRFTYVWIQFIKLLPRLRGQGKGSEIINSLALSYPSGTLIALSAEEVSSGKTASSLGMLKRFYKQNGFTLVRSQGKVFAFRVV